MYKLCECLMFLITDGYFLVLQRFTFGPSCVGGFGFIQSWYHTVADKILLSLKTAVLSVKLQICHSVKNKAYFKGTKAQRMALKLI